MPGPIRAKGSAFSLHRVWRQSRAALRPYYPGLARCRLPPRRRIGAAHQDVPGDAPPAGLAAVVGHGTGAVGSTEPADIRLRDAREALHQYPQWESDSSGHGWREELGTLASSLGLLVELAEGLESSAGVGACLSAVSP